MSLVLDEWSTLAPPTKRSHIDQALTWLPNNTDHFIKPWILNNSWVVDQFVSEIIAARNSGKTHYSAQRIYEYLAHRGQTRLKYFRFIEHNKAAQTLAATVTSIFHMELSRFFDESGVTV